MTLRAFLTSDRSVGRTLASLLLLWPLTLEAASPAASTRHDPAETHTPASMQAYLSKAYNDVHEASRDLEQVTARYCVAAAGGGDASTSAQQRMQTAFKALAISWSQIGFIRIGAFRDDNAGQRMLFWPDKRGNGERQIQQALATRPDVLLDSETLQQQSVALQGLPAYEAVLAQLTASSSQGPSQKNADFYCGYLTALADGMSDNSGQLADAMSQGSEILETITFAQWMEVVRGGLQISGEMKLKTISQSLRTHLASLGVTTGETQAELTHKVPFSRSNFALASLQAELDGIIGLLDSAHIESLLRDSDAGYLASVRFQLVQAAKAIETPERLEGRVISAAALKDAIEVLDFASGMLAQAGSDMTTTLYPALGLSRGFNSMDGD